MKGRNTYAQRKRDNDRGEKTYVQRWLEHRAEGYSVAKEGMEGVETGEARLPAHEEEHRKWVKEGGDVVGGKGIVAGSRFRAKSHRNCLSDGSGTTELER